MTHEEEKIIRAFRARLARRGASTPTGEPTDVPDAMRRLLNGVARGAVTGTVGMPGDIESLYDMGRGFVTGREPAKNVVPNSEDVGAWLEKLGWELGDTTPAKVGEFAGGFASLWPAAPLKRALAMRKAKKQRELEAIPAFAEGGLVRDDLDDLVDQAYMNIQLED